MTNVTVHGRDGGLTEATPYDVLGTVLGVHGFKTPKCFDRANLTKRNYHYVKKKTLSFSMYMYFDLSFT